MKEFIDRSSTAAGTPINRKNMMAIQGFNGNTIVFSNGGKTITETNSDGEIKTTTFSKNTITERFEGEKVITKTTTFNSDGSITEEIL